MSDDKKFSTTNLGESIPEKNNNLKNAMVMALNLNMLLTMDRLNMNVKDLYEISCDIEKELKTSECKVSNMDDISSNENNDTKEK